MTLEQKPKSETDGVVSAERESYCRLQADYNLWVNSIFALLAALIVAVFVLGIVAQAFQTKSESQARTIRRQNAAIAYYVKGERFAAASALSGE